MLIETVSVKMVRYAVPRVWSRWLGWVGRRRRSTTSRRTAFRVVYPRGHYAGRTGVRSRRVRRRGAWGRGLLR